MEPKLTPKQLDEGSSAVVNFKQYLKDQIKFRKTHKDVNKANEVLSLLIEAEGLEQKIGSIEVGKLADLTAIDMSSIALKPIYNPLSQLIYNCTSANISNVWIDGKRILQNKELLNFKMPELERKVDIWKEKIMSLASKIS